MSVPDLCELVVEATESLGESAAPLLTDISRRVDALVEVRLGYLNLDRSSPTLSGGEPQRVKMVRHLGSPLTEVTYVFDEPAAGLRPSDVQRLITLLTGLRDRKNTVLVVDHNPAVIAAADHVIGMGPGAGESGGRITFTGTPASVSNAEAPDSSRRSAHRPVPPRWSTPGATTSGISRNGPDRRPHRGHRSRRKR